MYYYESIYGVIIFNMTYYESIMIQKDKIANNFIFLMYYNY